MPYFTREMSTTLTRAFERIAASVYRPLTDLEVTAYVTREPVAFARRKSGKRLMLRPLDKWGDLFDCAWFHFTGAVPATAAGQNVVLLIDLNGEGLVVDEKGEPVQGLTNLSSTFDFSLGQPGKRVVPLLAKARGGERINLWVDAACNDLFGRLRNNGTLHQACVAVCCLPMRDLMYDCEVLHELMQQLLPESAHYQRIFAALCQVVKVLDRFDRTEAQAARAILAPELARKGGDLSLEISAIGHGHIDLGWLWPLRETLRKGARTFSTVLAMMDRYPDCVFGASQPQLYHWMKLHYPGLYRRIRRRVRQGRWEVQGATWVECDTNLTGAESLVRQVLYGKRFFRKEFDRDVNHVWLPDAFGFTGSLPQIMRKSGLRYFMTIKLSWCQVNRYPHHTFWWQGIDGSEVLVHMPPEDTYNGPASPRAIVKMEKNYLDKPVSDRCLMLFGIGDGGGGPGEEHLERLLREKDLAGLAPVTQEPAANLFKRLEPDSQRYGRWVGELYLENHQGTFTSQARSKRCNRKMELALHDLELAASQAMTLAGTPYPAHELETIWKEVLLYQFHDILPGSSIGRVYEESLARYAEMMEQVKHMTGQADAALHRRINTSGMRRPCVVTNSLSWERTEWLRAADKWVKVTVPPLGYATLDAAAVDKPRLPVLRADRRTIENDLLRIRFAADGSISGIFDKANRRQVLADGARGNRLAVYQDSSSAWDIPFDYTQRPPEHFRLLASTSAVDGPRASLTQEYAYGSSRLKQEIVLFAGSRRVDFITRVDWKERHRMLRTSFPVAARASEATCDIQFGTIHRPTHSNTSWDMAKFEIPAQKWIDLSQGDCGVALLNDCKYGHRVSGNVLDLNLLRSSSSPDPLADRARHEFTYSLFPHSGNHISGGVVRAGYELNLPLRATPVRPHPGRLHARASFIEVSTENVVVETVKKAEDDKTLIVRFYEAHAAGTKARVTFGFPVSRVELVNLMEEEPRRLRLVGLSVEVPFGPFEIQTLKVHSGSG